MTDQITIRNKVTNVTVTLDYFTTVYILDSVDWGTVESDHKFYKYINQIGVYVTSSTLETRTINVVGWITGANNDELHYLRRLLNKMINPTQLHEIETGNYKLEFLPQNSINYSVAYAQNNEVMCRFMISGFCPDPLFFGKSENRVEAASTYPMFRFPLRIPDVGQGKPDVPPGVSGGIVMGIREPSLLVDIQNDGDVPTGMRIEFYATATVTNPSIIDAMTLQYIKINKTMIAGERIVIVTQEGKKRVTGITNGVESNYYKYRDLNSSWLQLQVGDNLFRYDADGNVGNLEVTLYFDSRYLEVE